MQPLIMQNILPGGRDVYLPQSQGSQRCVLPRFDATKGLRHQISWPPPPDPNLERMGCHPTGQRCGPPAPGYQGQIWNCPGTTIVGQPLPAMGSSTLAAVSIGVLALYLVGGLAMGGVLYYVIKKREA